MRILMLIGLILLSKGVFASSCFYEVTPPDSTSSVVDRASAVLLIDEGKKLLNNGRTRDALAKFRQAYVKDKYSGRAAYWIGKAHYQLANYGYALQYAKIAESLSEAADGDVFYLLGEAYHRQNILDSARMNYDLALIQMRQSRSRAFNIQQKIDEVAYARATSNAEVKFQKQLVPGDVNSGYNDYAPLLTDNANTMYFVSRRPDTKGGGVNPDDQSYFEDIYRARWDSKTQTWDSITNDLGRLNSDGFDAVSHITPDGNTLYVTLNTSVLPIKKRTRSSDICTSDLSVKGQWSTPKPIKNKTINTSFFDGAATLTADGNTMYFVSDRRGEKSMSDIFVVERTGKNWGVARALPDHINSAGNETTPFITSDGRFLFFSSDGLTGMGGYDMYVSENLGNGQWSNPVNLGHEFNTVNNDTHFRYYPELNKGYFSSYRVQGQKASIDIFEINLEGWSIPRAR